MLNLYEKIQKLCEAQGVTVSALCRKLNISRSTLSELNAGRTKTLSTVVLNKIANHFGVTVDELIGNDPKDCLPEKTDIKKPTTNEGDGLNGLLQDPIEREIIETLKKLSPAGQELALAQLRALVGFEGRQEK